MDTLKTLRLVVASCAMLAIGAAFTAEAASQPATVTCKDGSTSKAGKGACSHHGGIQKGDAAAAKPAAAPSAAPAAPAAKPAPANAAADTDASGATAKCKDGTFSHSKNHTGACSKHGGVADWLGKKTSP